MITSGTLDKAMLGRENAKDWLILKIVECSVKPMDEKVAQQLSIYDAAYNALCRWGKEDSKTESVESNTPFTKDMALEWTSLMKNSDGSTGPHWTIDQTKQVMAQRGINCNPNDFYAVLNSLYSDFGEVFKKHGVSKMDFYADMAKAWIKDSDAVPDKAAAYFEYVVKH